MKNPELLGRKIKELRLKNDLSLRDLEKKSNVSYSFISSIENSRFNGSRETIAALADALEGADKNELLLLAGFAPEPAEVNEQKSPYYALTEKDERDIARDLEKIMDALDSESALAFHGEPMDKETRRLVRIAMENSMRMAREMAKKKFTPKKYRNDKNE